MFRTNLEMVLSIKPLIQALCFMLVVGIIRRALDWPVGVDLLGIIVMIGTLAWWSWRFWKR